MAEPVGWRVLVEVEPARVELVSDHLFLHGALGIEEREAPYERVQLLAGMPDEASARRAADALGEATVQPIHDDGWADEWRSWARPVRVDGIVVQPAWLPLDDEAVQCRVVTIDPGRAFGSGAHETTRLALRALLALDLGPAPRVLDVGCGSGVLAIVMAVVRGATVTAIDVDPAAVTATAENAARNDVSDLVHASATPLGELDGHYDVVVANILAVTLRELAADFARLVAANGVVVLSGMLCGQVAGVDAACATAGLDPVDRREAGEWCARTYARSAPS